MPLSELTLQFDDLQLSEVITCWIRNCQLRIDSFWDTLARRPHTQYVECDFEYVAQALTRLVDKRWIDGNLFVEWGCGFGVITGVAALLGLEAVGIEAEEFLCREAQKLLTQERIAAEIWHANFLPAGAERLAAAEDPIVSLGHRLQPEYARHKLYIEDFAVVFAYPWPDEEHFLKLVFERYARPRAILLLFRGPYHLEIYRKSQSRDEFGS